MYAWYECHYLIGTGTEAELLVELLTSRAVLWQRSPEPLNDVRGLDSRTMVLLEKTVLCFCYEGCSVLLCTEGAFRISIYRNDATRAGIFSLK